MWALLMTVSIILTNHFNIIRESLQPKALPLSLIDSKLQTANAPVSMNDTLQKHQRVKQNANTL